ncbi:MAG: metallophosphoesterase [Magnetococcales bacterium]|nr:metallophosphoesterase [Magnetococcales bacterium]
MKIILGLIVMLGIAWFRLDESKDLEVTRHHIDQETGAIHRLRIAQISDLHVVGHTMAEEKVLQELKREDPDLVVLTGDILAHRDKVAALSDFLGQLSERSEKYAILGNWEYWSGYDLKKLKQFYAERKITLLVNEAVMAGEKFGKPLLLVGLDDALNGHPDWEIAIKHHREWKGSTLILAHNPITVRQLPKDAHDLTDSVMLSGHTHGGQIVLFGLGVKSLGRDQPCWAGWCRSNGLAMYVSRGIGASVIPLRIGARPELALFDWAW